MHTYIHTYIHIHIQVQLHKQIDYLAVSPNLEGIAHAVRQLPPAWQKGFDHRPVVAEVQCCVPFYVRRDRGPSLRGWQPDSLDSFQKACLTDSILNARLDVLEDRLRGLAEATRHIVRRAPIMQEETTPTCQVRQVHTPSPSSTSLLQHHARILHRERARRSKQRAERKLSKLKSARPSFTTTPTVLKVDGRPTADRAK